MYAIDWSLFSDYERQVYDNVVKSDTIIPSVRVEVNAKYYKLQKEREQNNVR